MQITVDCVLETTYLNVTCSIEIIYDPNLGYIEVGVMYGIVMLDKSLVMWQKTGSKGTISKMQST